MTPGERLRALRGHLTANTVAQDLGISHSAYVKYERDERVPRDELKKKIALYFGKTVQDIFFS